MNVERSILIAFLGNYLINTVVSATVSLLPQKVLYTIGHDADVTKNFDITVQYIAFIFLAIVLVGVLAWWYMREGKRDLKSGLLFGLVGFVVAVVAAFVSGIAGLLLSPQTYGSLSAVADILPKFLPYLFNWSTLILLVYWVLPGTVLGWYATRKMMPTPASTGM